MTWNWKMQALFFDADSDGDMDLYIATGGNEYPDMDKRYADRLYINDGKGNFTRNAEASRLPIPAVLSLPLPTLTKTATWICL